MNYNPNEKLPQAASSDMGGFGSVGEITALADMLGGLGQEDDQHLYGSALNPRSLHHLNANGEKEIAKPGVKMEVIPGNRNPLTGGAIISKAKLEEEATAKKEEGKDIWTEREVNIAAEERPDDRPEPKYDILHK